jgi:2-polyprenyl-3-methyl-5-hydroxy-6-metoxy-1,4-benzoquinol methylase
LKGDLLDFGAGTGNLTQRACSLGQFNSVTAIDMMQRPTGIHNSVKWISSDLNQSTNFPDQTFDVIISAEVIEHLENPRAVSREWYRLLRPSGTLIFSTPNNESWRSLLALLMIGNFVAFTDSSYPSHITPLVRKDIERILFETGFINRQILFTNIGSIPKFPQFSWQAFSGGILKGLRYSDNVIAIAYKS